MIIQIFNKSKPINLVIASFLVIMGFLVSSFSPHFEWKLNAIPAILTSIFSMLVVDFISKKNQLCYKNSFVILFFSLFFNLYWMSTNDYAVLYANFFILLAFRKIISLKSHKNTLQKIFDAGFLIAVATLFSFWSVLFYIILYASITLYASGNYKHYLVPFISVFALYAIVNSYSLYINHTLFKYPDTNISLDYTQLFTFKNTLIISLLTIITFLALLFTPISIKDLSKKNKTSYLVVAVSLIIGIVIFIFNSKIDTLLFTYFPISIFLSIIIEKVNQKWIPQVVFYLLLSCITILYFI